MPCDNQPMMSSARSEVTTKRSVFSVQEKRNIIIYILGIVLYKFGLEAFNGSIITLATNRFDQDALKDHVAAHTFEKVGLVAGLNQALQCLGSILISPLIKHFPTRLVLSVAIFIFGIFTAILVILDSATGGTFKPKNFNSTNKDDFSYYGDYKSDWIILIFGVTVTGIAYGTVESIHRVIPTDIVGNHVEKLQRFDALVHIFYAVSGSVGALMTGLVLIPKLGNNYAFIITPIFFTAAGMVWLLMSSLKKKKRKRIYQSVSDGKQRQSNYLRLILRKIAAFGQTLYIGGKIIVTNRKYIWIFSGYSLTLYAHRYLEDGIAPQVARRYLGNSAWSEIIVSGSNVGELLGSCFILFLANSFRTPIPWLRISAVVLLIIWYIPFYYPSAQSIKYAWIVAVTFFPISFGWAAGDIALAAHIQSSMTRLEPQYEDVSVLGAVMSFLYSSYIIIYAIANPFLGKFIDRTYKHTESIRPALVYTAGVQFTIIAVIVLASTFIPPGALVFNPVLPEEDEDSSDDAHNAEELLDVNRSPSETINS